MDIIKSEYVSFEEYKQLVDKYVALDNREINFQDRVVLQLIDRILANSDELSVVDVHAQYKNRESGLHKREFYAGDHTPDLLIARDWHYENRGKDKSDYIAIVEIKSPALDPISKDSSHTSEEMEEYFGICDKVILTDCYTWKFYLSGNEVKSFELHDQKDWVLKKVDNPEFIQDMLGAEPYRMESKEWDALVKYLKVFLCEKIVRVVAAVIREDDRIFATARGYGEFKGQWEFPGGKIEARELPQDALKREIHEELEALIRVGSLIDTIEYDYPTFHLSMDCFWANVESGELVLKEAEAAKWLTVDELDSVQWLPADLTLIEEIRKTIQNAAEK